MVGAIWNAIAIIVGLIILIPLLIFVTAILVALLLKIFEGIGSFFEMVVDKFNQNN